MSDLYSQLVSLPVAGTVAKRIGLPQPVELDRSEPLGEVPRDKLNVNGGSLAAGHPFAATGGRIVASLAKALDERGSGRGVISICAAGGQGVVAILEKDA